MEMIRIYDKYIELLNDFDALEKSQQEETIEEITRVLFEPDDLRNLVLSYYHDEEPDFKADARKLKAKLELDKASLIDADTRKLLKEKAEEETRELEKLRLQVEQSKGNVTIHNTNKNEASAVSSVSITIEQTIHSVNELSDDKLTDNEKSEIAEKLYAMEGAKKSGDKKKVSATLGKVLKYIADKGVEVGIALLPYLGEISKFIQGS